MKRLSLLASAAACCAVLAAPAVAAGGYAQTQYPIVLAHGLFGFDKIAGVDYYYGIPQALRDQGAKVYGTTVSATNSNAVRNEQFVQQVQAVMAVTGAAKVNIIGHSQGSASARYAAAVLPGKVASVTAVSGVIGGSKVADLVLGIEPLLGPLAGGLYGLVNSVGSLIAALGGQPGLPQDTKAALASLSSAGAAQYNAAFPAGVPTTSCGQGAAVVNGTRYYSWGSVGQFTNPLDFADGLFVLTGAAFMGAKNDGLVGQCATHLGTVIRDDYPANHIDTTNQLFGAVGLGFNPVTVYLQHANRLKLAGL